MRIVGNLGRDYANAFKELYPRVAEKQEVILIPFFLEAVAGEPGLNQPDAIHPTSQGYEIVTKTVYPYVVEAIKKHGRE
jgi:acyl-CoA thioesterase-1